MFTPGIAFIIPIAKLIAEIKPLMIRQAVESMPFTALPTTPVIAFPTTSPTRLKMPVMLDHIPLKNPTILPNTLVMILTAPLNIPLKKDTTPLNTDLIPPHILLAIFTMVEKMPLTVLTTPLNIVEKNPTATEKID